MKLAALSLATLFAGLSLAACAPDADFDSLESAGDQTADISATSRTFVALRHDYRKCMSPMCGGYFVHDVNRKHLNEKYVSGLDFANAGLDQATIDQVTSAPDGEVVLYGKLGPIDATFGTRTFLVFEAYRGMPGAAPASGDLFYSVTDHQLQCFAAPCNSLEAEKLNSTSSKMFTGIDAEIGTNVSADWLAHRAATGGALVAGSLQNGQTFPAGTEKLLVASQVFLHLPEAAGPCPKSPEPLCEDGTVGTYVYTADRCTVFDTCATAGACIALAPTCDEGYAIVSWPSQPFGCSAYTCEPAFLHPEL